MLTDKQIENNKKRFLELLLTTSQRPGVNTSKLTEQLEKSDFFFAPASTKYHGAYTGGLCEHCLNVYDNIVKLNEAFNCGYDNTTLIIVALLHDFSKMNFYTTEWKNKKVYKQGGSKMDSNGHYDWESYQAFTIKDAKDRLCIGNHESTSAFMANTFVALSFEEYAAIENHHAGTNYDSVPDVWMRVYEKYPLARLLNMANMMDMFNEETRDE